MTFPLFLSVLFGAMSFASIITWLASRGGGSSH